MRRPGDGAAGGGPGDDRPPALRACSPRALLIALLATVVLAVWIPINDWQLGNTQMYNNYLPPVVVGVLLLLALGVNPLLRLRRPARRAGALTALVFAALAALVAAVGVMLDAAPRTVGQAAWGLVAAVGLAAVVAGGLLLRHGPLRRGELVVIAIMLLGLGGVVSGGLVRVLPIVMTVPARHVASKPAFESLRVPLDETRQAALRAEVMAVARADVRVWDRDGDGALDADELPGGADALGAADADGDGVVDGEELGAQRLRYDASMLADWRWALPEDLVLGVPRAGPIATGDARYRHVVDGYLDGLPESGSEPPIEHRSRVTWRVAGEMRTQVALAGRERDQARRLERDFLDLEDPRFGGRLRGLRAGDSLHLGDGRQVEVLAVGAPGVPLADWWWPFLHWLPLLLGALVAMVAVAGIVRRQWIHHERLPYPVAEVMTALADEPRPGARWPRLFADRGFWVAAIATALVLGWRGLATYDLVPVTIALELDLTRVLRGGVWSDMPERWWLAKPTLWLGFAAMTFFMRLDVSFSLWFMFVASNLVAALATAGGMPIAYDEILHATVGGFGAMCLFVCYLGRHHYWAMCKAAVGRNREPEARAAAGYLWLLIAGCATVVVALMWHGAPFTGALLLVLILLGLLLVLARIVAEAGVPFVQTGELNRANVILFSFYGLGISPLALMPIAIVGGALGADNREALLPYAVNAGAMGERAGVRHQAVSKLLLTGVVLGLGLAFVAMVMAGYLGQGGGEWWPMWFTEGKVLQPVADLAAADASPNAHARMVDERQSTWLGYGAGAGIVGLLGWARLAFTWWPLHPVGVLLMASYCTKVLWATFFVGWLGKFAVMRYGGTRLYQRLKPVAIGVICGEAASAMLFLVVRTLAAALGHELPVFKILPL